jgi:DNA-binding NarL/FixJ family response regulator
MRRSICDGERGCGSTTMTKRTSTSPDDTNPLRVFIVEDSVAVREFVAEILEEIQGILLCGFSDTEDDALDHLRGHGCDVLILDIQLKQGNGMSLLRSLARESVQPALLKIIFSNNVSGAYRRIGQQYGVQYFFDKASQFLELRSLLERLAAGASVAGSPSLLP